MQTFDNERYCTATALVVALTELLQMALDMCKGSHFECGLPDLQVLLFLSLLCRQI